MVIGGSQKDIFWTCIGKAPPQDIGRRENDDMTLDKRTAFMELSALLTGVYAIASDSQNKPLNESTADEYLRRLLGEFPERLPKLLDAYDRLASANPKPAIDDALLGKLKAEPEF